MSVPQIAPVDARAAQSAGAVLLDVREQDEWDAGHVAGAVHVPMSELAGRLDDVPQADRLIVVCRVGARSDAVAQALAGMGHPGVENLAGGLLGWQAAGLPLEPPDGRVS